MAKDNNSILIKDARGQFRTVSLGVAHGNQIDGVSPVRLRPSASKNHKDLLDYGGQAQVNNLALKDKDEAVKQESEKSEKIVEPLAKKREDLMWMGPIPAEVVMPAFYFHLEDEEEAAQFKDKEQILKLVQKQKNLAYLIDEVIKIIKEKGLELSESVIRRLKRVIDSRWREVRDLMETKEALVRAKELGGAGLSNEQAQEVLKVIEDKRMEFQDGVEDIKTQEHESIKAKEEKEEIEKFRNKETEEDVLTKIKPVSTYVHPSYQEEEMRSRIPGQVMTTSQEIVRPEVKKEPVSQPPIVSPTLTMRRTWPSTGPKLTGPIEELGSFDLASFRALGDGPLDEVMVKIKNKIELLQDESYAKRAEGVRAWRSCPLYQSYLSLGQESIEKNQPVANVIQEKQRRGEPCLMIEEFEAMADLNKELSY